MKFKNGRTPRDGDIILLVISTSKKHPSSYLTNSKWKFKMYDTNYGRSRIGLKSHYSCGCFYGTKNITWDNLQKRGFHEPLIYQLCFSNDEDVNNLFNKYNFSSTILDHLATIFKEPAILLDNIITNFENCTWHPFQNYILNRSW